MKRIRIALLAYPGCMGLQLFSVADILAIGADLARSPITLELQWVSLHGRRVRLSGGTALEAVKPTGKYDVLVVPGFGLTRPVDWQLKLGARTREIAFIRRCFTRGTRVASACVGAFLLAEAGLLDGRKAVTSWLFAGELARRYPAADVQAEALLLEDSAVITTGAVSAATDLAIFLVKRLFGAEAAVATARVTLLAEQRNSQAPYVDANVAAQSLPEFSQRLLEWFNKRLSVPYSLQKAAAAFHTSPSTLMRRVRNETGQTPLALLHGARVEKARQLLRTTTWNMPRIAEAVGYADASSFSRLFSRLTGQTPMRYRRQ
ncbi:GlxA family transcriptional regulator [Pseudoduganella sp. S-14]|jgi:transcriptional regulator GlxA family with amidase domain|uniref:GlxA family transcriptional regulator n=1 Tax=Pseudoduganella sp. S-14 TaxID=3404065 RepID=UPI003CF1967D